MNFKLKTVNPNFLIHRSIPIPLLSIFLVLQLAFQAVAKIFPVFKNGIIEQPEICNTWSILRMVGGILA